MSLQDWLKSGRFKTHKTGSREIAQLLGQLTVTWRMPMYMP